MRLTPTDAAGARRHRGRTARALALAAVVVVGAPLADATAPAPAVAAGAPAPRLMLSDDGDVWHRHLSTALFGDALVLVPGASSTATLWVANVSELPAVLAAAVEVDETSAPELVRWTSASVALPDGHALDGAECAGTRHCPEAGRVVVGAGGQVPLAVSLELDERAPAAAADSAFSATVRVTLTGLAVDADAGCATTGPSTGATVPVAAPGASGPRPDGTRGSAAGGAGAAAVPGEEPSVLVPTRTPEGPRTLQAPSTLRPAGSGSPWPWDLDPFVSVPLRGSWLPVALAGVAAGAGVLLALARRRRRDGEEAP